ncbi:hypothetical protein EIL50_02595 [bacterium NHP-B]|nr:hypothetical protein EIL50_02595 [bacterium NHP-B]
MKYVYFGFSLAILTAFTTPSVYGPPPPPASPEEVHAKIVVDDKSLPHALPPLSSHRDGFYFPTTIEEIPLTHGLHPFPDALDERLTRAIHALSHLFTKAPFIDKPIMDEMEKLFMKTENIDRYTYPIGSILDSGVIATIIHNNDRLYDPFLLERFYELDKRYADVLDQDWVGRSLGTRPDLEEVSGTSDE